MRDFDERTIWTSERIPLMASYNKGFAFSFCVINTFFLFFFFKYGVRVCSICIIYLCLCDYGAVKMQHSVWVAEVINSSLEVENASLSATVPAGVFPKRFCFRRIWQGKGAHTAASTVLDSLLFFGFSLYSVIPRWFCVIIISIS